MDAALSFTTKISTVLKQKSGYCVALVNNKKEDNDDGDDDEHDEDEDDDD